MRIEKHRSLLEGIVTAFDELDASERSQFSPDEDRKWMWAAMKPGRAEYHERYNGPEEVIEWMCTALAHDRGGYLPESVRAPLVRQSRVFDMEAFPNLIKYMSEVEYDRTLGRWNADDFYYANAYHVPKHQNVHRLLDFGAGYGRQLNLWSQNVSDLHYLAIDTIRKPYLTQACYYLKFDLPMHEYVIDPNAFRITDSPGIYHLPSWRWDLVPTDSYDMILAVMVLPELHADTLHRTLVQFVRVLKPGGALFIRDHGLVIKSANTEDVAVRLHELGFVLEFRPYVKDQKDLRGIPRIWRKRKHGVQVADEAE
jgi:SAM-dependent methyltransferase